MHPSPSSFLQQSMANLQNCKRRNTDDLTQDSPPAKRIKSSSALRKAVNFPPQFWDNLSKIWLTPRALRELDRRNDAKPPARNSAAFSRVSPTTLARFARRGGPDIRHLRGCPEPREATQMSSNRSLASSSRRTQSTKATSVSKGKRSSAYNKDFEQNLIDHSIYPEGYEHTDDRSTPEPNNLDDIIQGLSNPRASLSPSRFSVSAFKGFKQANSRVISEGKVMADILPIIRGNADIPNEGNLLFTNLDSITNGTTVDAVPDLYDGSYPKQVSKMVRQDLNKTIAPTTHGRAPLAPNFFVEAKAPRGGADVAKRQACLDGAVGARAMHTLQNYGEAPVYDGNARTFSSTYHAGTGTLQLYAHHITGPMVEGELPEYHMTQLRTFGMTDTRETFIAGATAFRNARDIAQKQRETFIQAANGRASQTRPAAFTAGETYEGNARHDSEASAWQNSHDDLQQHIAETFIEECEDNNEAPTTPSHHYALDDSHDLGQDAASGTDDPSMSFVSGEASFTSSFSTDTTRPKRSRQSFSSPTQESRSSKIKVVS
ncbi:hypothetical protein MY4824_001465 [Beauveria thailandica]